MTKQAMINESKPMLDKLEEGVSGVEKLLDVVDKSVDAGTDVIEHGLEKVADVVPEAIDTAVHVSTKSTRGLVRHFRNPKTAALTAAGLCIAAGAGLGVVAYFATVKHVKSKLQKEMDEKLEAEIEKMRLHYARLNKDGEYSTPQAAVEALLTAEAAAALKEYRGEGGEPQIITGTPEVVVQESETDETPTASELKDKGFTDEQIRDSIGESGQFATEEQIAALRDRLQSGTNVPATTSYNVFSSSAGDFDYAEEVRKRNPEEPYVITHGEFMENENGWEQHSFTYYNGDDTLVDDQNTPIPDVEEIVDSTNLSKFGHGSGDPRIVYVRNEKREMDIEIALHDGEFAKVVSGFGSEKSELRHSDSRRSFRRGDDG